MPIITFIDTPRYSRVGAEESVVSSKLVACNLREMSRLNVPVICTVLAKAARRRIGDWRGDKVNMLQYSTYSVISPEGCASFCEERRQSAIGR